MYKFLVNLFICKDNHNYKTQFYDVFSSMSGLFPFANWEECPKCGTKKPNSYNDGE